MAKRRNSGLIPLRDAPWHFASRRLKAELDRVRSLPHKFAPPTKPDSRADAFKVFGQLIQTATKDLSVRNKPLWDMQEALILRLAAGGLEAFGIMIKPRLGSGPQKIPSFVFKNRPKVRWDINSVENFGHKFEGVEVQRVTEVRAMTDGNEVSVSPGAKARKVGRPRVDVQIVEVIRELKEGGRFASKSEKERVTIVQAIARKRYPTRFPKPSQPSLTKIRELMKREGI